MSPGLMLSLKPDSAPWLSSGMCHSGPSKRGKNSQRISVSGSACASTRPARRTLGCHAGGGVEMVSRSSAAPVSHETAIK